ncbi:MAG: hypothetical protein K6E83_04900 [Clostridium sp.]|nr:hypothetical protein [Clostridium sp.]
MRWKHLFEPEILKRGLSCYREGRVFRAAKKGNEYTGVVRGSENYAVKARFHDSGILSSLGCSCPHARNGHFCKHMAALLFAVENEDFRTDPDLAASGQSIWKDAEIPETELSEIAEKHSQDYHYFDFPAMIRELGMRHGVWERGKALARSGAVIITEFLFQPSSFAGSGKTPVTEGYVTGEVRTGHGEDVRVRASLSRERIEVLRCGITGCPGPRYAGYGAKDLCEHEAALVYLIGQYILEKNPGDATNDSGARLLEDMGKIIDRPEEISELRQEIAGLTVRRPIRLEAGIIRRSGVSFPEAVFRVGENRLYRIHALDEFVQAVTGGSSMRFGQSTVLAFREDRIAEESRPLWNFIKDAVLDMRQ